MVRDLVISFRNMLVLWLLTALIYPLFLLIVGQALFPYQANGSLIRTEAGQIVGSELIGQTFSSDRYFWGRPSAISYSEGKDAAPTGLSGASNLAPGNPALLERMNTELKRWQAQGLKPTADLLYASGSGLDPHISPAAAQLQAERVAQARGLEPARVKSLIVEHIQGRLLGIWGEPVVNVLRLNLDLDRLDAS